MKKKELPEYDGVAAAKALPFVLSRISPATTINGDDDGTSSILNEVPAPSSPDSSKTRRVSRRKPKSGDFPKNKAKTSLYVSPETLHDLRVYCADIGVRMTDFVEAAVKDRLKMERKKRAKEE